MKFKYVALDKNRKKIKGNVEYATRTEAIQQLKGLGYRVLKLSIVKESKTKKILNEGTTKAKKLYSKQFGGKTRKKQYESFKEELLFLGYDVTNEVKNIVPANFDIEKYREKYELTDIQVEKIISGRLNKEEALKGTDISTNEKQRFSFKKKVSLKELINFTEQLAILLATDVTLVESLETIQKNMKNKKFKSIIDTVIYDLTKGKEFSTSLETHSDIFSPLYIAMIKVGEKTGSELPKALEDMVKFLKMSLQIKREVTKAMIYPGFVVVALIGLLFFVSKFVMPRLNAVFENNNFVMPKFTQVIFMISENVGTILIGGIAFIALLVFLYMKVTYIHDKVKGFFDKYSLKLPIVNTALLTGYMYQITLTMAITLKNGISITDALNLVSNVLSNKLLRGDIGEIYYGLEKGRDIADAFGEQERMDSLVKMAVASGEKSGRLSEGLERVSEYYEGELKNKVATLMEVMVPVSIIVLACVIAPFIIGIYYPIISLTQQVGSMR